MPIEIEKKYRLTLKQRRALEQRLHALGLTPGEVEFEENTLYQGGELEYGTSALRLRRVNGRAILTFKRRLPSRSLIKHQEENETIVADADAADGILRGLGFRPGLIYEKRRTRWTIDGVKLVIDELPFGLFMEIEASVKDIKRVEKLLDAGELPAVLDTYPSLTAKLGKRRQGIIEARFPNRKRSRR